MRKEGQRQRRRWRCFGRRLKQCDRSEKERDGKEREKERNNAGVTALRCIHGPWTRMDLNENLLINNRQVWARFLFLHYMFVSFCLLLFLNSSCFESRTRMEGRRDGAKQAPNMKMDVVRGAAVTWQAFHQTSSCTSWQTKKLNCDTLHREKKLWNVFERSS